MGKTKRRIAVEFSEIKSKKVKKSKSDLLIYFFYFPLRIVLPRLEEDGLPNLGTLLGNKKVKQVNPYLLFYLLYFFISDRSTAIGEDEMANRGRLLWGKS